MKTNKLLMPGTTSMNLQNIKLSERSPAQKTTMQRLEKQIHRQCVKQSRAGSGGQTGCVRAPENALGEGNVLELGCDDDCATL